MPETFVIQGVPVFKITLNLDEVLSDFDRMDKSGRDAVREAIYSKQEELQKDIDRENYSHVKHRSGKLGGELGGAFWVTSSVSSSIVKITVEADYKSVPYIGSHVRLVSSDPVNLPVYPKTKVALSLPFFEDDEFSEPIFGPIYGGVIHDNNGIPKRVLKPFTIQHRRVSLFKLFERVEAELPDVIRNAYETGFTKSLGK